VPANSRHAVLVIDDNEDVREAVETALDLAGYTTVPAADGKAALELLRAGLQPIVILLDLMMPVMDGLEFLDAQRRDPRLAAIPVIIVSAFSRLAEAERLGATAVLTKPVDFGELLALIARHGRDDH
jgi:CheY-like chemotaxis protein